MSTVALTMDVETQHQRMESKCVAIIQEWFASGLSFTPRNEKAFITKFLHASSYDVEKTKQKITTYYELRRDYSGMLTNRDFLEEKILKAYNRCYITVDFEPRKHQQKPVIITLNYSKLKPKDDLYTSIRLLVICAETLFMDPIRAQPNGSICIINMGDMSFSRLLHYTPDVIEKLVKCLLEGVPSKPQQIHIINVNAIILVTVNIFRLCMPSKLRDILYVHRGSWDCLKDYVSPSCLPQEYGGTNGTLEENREAFREKLLQWRPYLLEDEKYGFGNVRHRK